ncbi:MAG: hypothetical protein Q4E12_00115 [Coriobacteriia bacterium]|nr:hypothetical protein [Coriobacteriia bacterium]
MEAIIGKTEKRLEHAPDGILHITRSHGVVQYRQRFKRGMPETYLGPNQEELKKQLAQKGYDQKVLKLARAEKELIGAYLLKENEAPGSKASDADTCPTAKSATQPPLRISPYPTLHAIKQLYEHLSPELQSLVTPCVMPDGEFRAAWEAAEVAGSTLSREGCIFQTERGEFVRSKSETIIADRLFRAGVPYRYEQPLQMQNGVTVHPDFVALNTLTRQEFVWEHFGLMDDSEYAGKTVQKINAYIESGLVPGCGLIITFESAAVPLNVATIEANIAAFLL